MVLNRRDLYCLNCELLNPFRAVVPFWGQTSQISSSLSPKRDCGFKGVNRKWKWKPLGYVQRYNRKWPNVQTPLRNRNPIFLPGVKVGDVFIPPPPCQTLGNCRNYQKLPSRVSFYFVDPLLYDTPCLQPPNCVPGGAVGIDSLQQAPDRDIFR